MNCVEELTKDILFDCLDNLVKGIDKGKAVLINRNDIDFSRSKKEGATISDIYLKAGKRGYVVESGKNLASANAAFLPSTDDLEGFSHSFLGRIMTTVFESAERANELKQGRFIVVYQSRYKGIDNKEAFKVLGWEAGLMLKELKQNTAENRSSLLFTLSTEEGESESVPYLSFFDTNYYISNRLFEDKLRKNMLIQMSEAGTMDFSVSGATGVEWEMYTGEVYTQNSEVPSGDINRPQIQFTEAGWVKLYVDDFSIASIARNTYPGLVISSTNDFHVKCLDLNMSYTSVSGFIGVLNCIRDLDAAFILGRLTGDVSDISATSFVNIDGQRELSINSESNSISANTMLFKNCDFSQTEIYNLIKYNYDLNKQNGQLDVTGINAIPDAATELLIAEMEANRGWSIATN